MERLSFGIFLILVVIGCGWEFNRWRNPDYRLGLTQSQRARRVVGAALLLAVGGLCFGNTYLPGPPELLPRPIQAMEMLYWGVCMLLGLAIPVVAYFEWKEAMQLVGEERRRLRRQVRDLEQMQSEGDDQPTQ